MNDGLTARDISRIVGGTLKGNPLASVIRGRADSRLCRPGDLYAALPGERTDGSLFVSSAWENGAEAALACAVKSIPDPPPGKALVSVDDPLCSLQELARVLRRRSAGLKVVGITGSNGKTTTKEILASILLSWKGGAVLISEGNYNSDIGLPLTLVGLRREHEIAILEMGMNRIGEIALLAEIARPDIALITNIGTAHIGRLGSRDAIAQEKRSIFSMAGPGTVAVIGADEPWAGFLLEGFPGRTRRFGLWGSSGWDSYEEVGPDGWILVRRGARVRFPLPGTHNLLNAMAAVEAALALGAPEEAVVQGLESVRSSFGRSEIVEGPVTVIRDYYNANPESLGAALKLFSSIGTRGRRVLVLGELLELGDETEKALKSSGAAAAAAEPDEIVLFGESLRALKDGARAAGYAGPVHIFADMEAMGSFLSTYLEPGDLVLLKGSRGSALERLDPVLERFGPV